MAASSATRGSIAFGIAVGLFVAVFSYRWIMDPGRGVERGAEERAVHAARTQVVVLLGLASAEFVDAVDPDRTVGKTYVYPVAGGWEVSGYYRRDERDAWHPYLATIGEDHGTRSLRVRDGAPGISAHAAVDGRIEVLR